MKRLSLSQACLLHAAGEMGESSSKRLMEHIETYPAAMVEYEQAVAKIATLKSIPSIDDELKPLEQERIRSQIVRGVMEKQRRQKRAELKQKLRPLFYRTMSIASGVAAALVVMAGIHVVQMRSAARAQRLRDAVTDFREFAQTDLPASRMLRLQKLDSVGGMSSGSDEFDADAPIGASNNLVQFLNALDRIKLSAESAVNPAQ
ncbi:MAG: hypothetical protein ACP5O1_00810 [Phycisphaerae bacterium]